MPSEDPAPPAGEARRIPATPQHADAQTDRPTAPPVTAQGGTDAQ